MWPVPEHTSVSLFEGGNGIVCSGCRLVRFLTELLHARRSWGCVPARKRNNGYYVEVCFKRLNHDQQLDGPLTLTGKHKRFFMIIQPALNITAPDWRNQYRGPGTTVRRDEDAIKVMTWSPVKNNSCPRRPPQVLWEHHLFGPQIFFRNTAMMIAKGTFTISGWKNSLIQHRFREEKTV